MKRFIDTEPAHADAREPVRTWYRQVKAADWASPTDIKRDIRSASNKYRIVAWINYPYRVVYVRFIGSHRTYDAIDAQTI